MRGNRRARLLQRNDKRPERRFYTLLFWPFEAINPSRDFTVIRFPVCGQKLKKYKKVLQTEML